MPKQNFLSPEFLTKYQRELPIFLKMREFYFNTVWFWHGSFLAPILIDGRKFPCQNQLDSFIRFDTTPTCDRHRQTQTRGQS